MLTNFWPAVETAGVDDPQPLLVAADWYDENEKPDLAHFLKWCAGKRKRPFRRTEVIRKPWTWWCWTKRSEGEMGPKRFKHRHAAFLQYIFFDAMKSNHEPEGFATCHEAYVWGAEALKRLRSVVDVPNIVVPPQPQVIRLEHLSCERCGLIRTAATVTCPVCKT